MNEYIYNRNIGLLKITQHMWQACYSQRYRFSLSSVKRVESRISSNPAAAKYSASRTVETEMHLLDPSVSITAISLLKRIKKKHRITKGYIQHPFSDISNTLLGWVKTPHPPPPQLENDSQTQRNFFFFLISEAFAPNLQIGTPL